MSHLKNQFLQLVNYAVVILVGKRTRCYANMANLYSVAYLLNLNGLYY